MLTRVSSEAQAEEDAAACVGAGEAAVGVLSFSFLLMVINRGASFVLPLNFRPLVDRVFNHGEMQLLPGIITKVVAATIIQGITSYALTQMLSKGGQRLISELRTKVQDRTSACCRFRSMTKTAPAHWFRAS